jgi:hypothetical protein
MVFYLFDFGYSLNDWKVCKVPLSWLQKKQYDYKERRYYFLIILSTIIKASRAVLGKWSIISLCMVLKLEF